MKWNFAAKFITAFLAFVGLNEVPTEEGKVALTEEQEGLLKDALKDEAKDPDGSKSLATMVAAIEKDLAAANVDQEKLRKDLREALTETSLSETEIEKLVQNEDGSIDQSAFLAAIKGEFKNQKELINKLMNSDEPDDSTELQELKNKVMRHSKTHLFGTGNSYDAFEGRPWNQRAAGVKVGATDWAKDTAQVEKLNGDLDLYYRENPTEIKSLERDKFGLPLFWNKVLNVVDIIADGTIISGEITQARKLPWLPKNKQLIKPEEGKVFPVQIDIEYVGYFLQKIEASWLNMMNNEGSQPYKESFVRFLVSELDKKARVEDRISSILGVHVDTPEDATVPGRFLNRQDGLLYQMYRAQKLTKKYKAFSLGTPTKMNIIDYVDGFMESLPLEIRRNPGMHFYVSPAWLKAYGDRYEQLHGTNNDYSGVPPYPKGYNNMPFEALHDLEGTDIMFVTFDDNIEILEYVPSEKSMYHFEKLLRKIYVMADYKLGIRLVHIGNKLKEGDPLEFKVQSIWSNDVPMFTKDYAIPLFDDATGEISAKFEHIKVSDDWNTSIATINNAVPGQLIKIQGNTALASVKNVVSSGNIGLTGGTFNLKSGGTLTLYVKADKSIVELSRTTAPEAAPSANVNFDAGTIDANAGTEFYSTAVADETLDGITNGVDGQEISVYGPAGAATLTLANVAGNISMISGAVLATAADVVKLVKVAGIWYESDRTIA